MREVNFLMFSVQESRPMSMSVGPASGDMDAMVEMNTTPLIDVMLVLLVMLIVTLPVQRHAVKLDMPRPNSDNKPTTPPVVVDLVVDFDGTILWNGNTSTFDQDSAPSGVVSHPGSAARDSLAPQPSREIRHGGEGAWRGAAFRSYEDRICRERPIPSTNSGFGHRRS